MLNTAVDAEGKYGDAWRFLNPFCSCSFVLNLFGNFTEKQISPRRQVINIHKVSNALITYKARKEFNNSFMSHDELLRPTLGPQLMNFLTPNSKLKLFRYKISVQKNSKI